jgi:hypothetical protein
LIRIPRPVVSVAPILGIPVGTDRIALNALIGWAEVNRPWCLPLFRMVLTGELLFITPARDQVLPDLRRVRMPVMVGISAGYDTASGPSRWHHAEGIFAWARGNVLVHAEEPSVDAYEPAVAKVMETGRFVIVETTEEFVGEWEEFSRVARGD